MPVSKRRKGVKSKQARRSTMNKPNKPDGKGFKKDVGLNHIFNSDVPLLYSDNLLVQFRDGLFTMMLMQHQFPVIFEKEEIHQFETIDSVCVGRYVITPVQQAKNIKALVDNFNNYLKLVGSEAKDYKEFLELAEKSKTKKEVENK